MLDKLRLADRILQVSARDILLILIAVFVVMYSLGIDRQSMIDQENYLQYFYDAKTIPLADRFALQFDSASGFAALLVEEPLWILWTEIVSELFDPNSAVYFTVVVLNVLVFVAIWHCRNSLTAALLWLVVPVGFAIVGTYQIRQGFAFALWLMLTVRARKLVLATILAGLIHTTFLVLIPLAWVAQKNRWPIQLRLLVSLVYSLSIATSGQLLFELIGGRRLLVYLDSDQVFSFNFLYGLVLLLIFPAAIIFADAVDDRTDTARSLEIEALCFYLSVLVLLMVCFAIFPLAVNRLNYFSLLGLIPIVGRANCSGLRQSGRRGLVVAAGATVLLFFLGYSVLSALSAARYACILEDNCAVVLGQ